MKVLKFGGTSVGSPERMTQVKDIILSQEGKKVVVLSAVAGTTNALVDIHTALDKGQQDQAAELLANLRSYYNHFIRDLFSTDQGHLDAEKVIHEHFGQIEKWVQEPFSKVIERSILAQGELISTKLFYHYLSEQSITSELLPALSFMRTDHHKEPEMAFIQSKIHEQLRRLEDTDLFITQGYICMNDQGEVDNLRRGGSDYTATILGAVLNAEEIQIWTDISGLHNNDPRVVEKTIPVHHLSFEEAAELAYFGAKILHPLCVFPAQRYNVPVKLLNTMDTSAEGTLIDQKGEEGIITAIAAKDNITAIKIKSSRMLMAYGFLTRVFQIFEKHQTPIDMITTSEVAVSLTIDDYTNLDLIITELTEFGKVEVDKDHSIICVVGNFVAQNKGVVKCVFDALENVPVRMISYGGSRHNISLLVKTEYKTMALQLLNRELFELN